MTPGLTGWFTVARPPETYPEVEAYPGLTADHRVCECAVCGRLLVAPEHWDRRPGLPPPVACRWRGRPRCQQCRPGDPDPGLWTGYPGAEVPAFLLGLMTEGGRRVVRKAVVEPNPWAEVAVRAGEDAVEEPA
jgi:hypothetical protein